MIKDIAIRKAEVKDLNQICEVFKLSIEKTCHNDYNVPQISAWSSAGTNYGNWIQKISTLFFIVAEKENMIVGFAALEQNTLDLLYVHPDFQHFGVGTELFLTIENELRKQLIPNIFTESSITAKPFFLQRGFNLITENMVQINGTDIPNFKMRKHLNN